MEGHSDGWAHLMGRCMESWTAGWKYTWIDAIILNRWTDRWILERWMDG